LSRVLQWEGSLSSVEGQGGLGGLLHDIDQAAVTMLDRWTVAIKEKNIVQGRDEKQVKFMTNYLGALADVDASYQFFWDLFLFLFVL